MQCQRVWCLFFSCPDEERETVVVLARRWLVLSLQFQPQLRGSVCSRLLLLPEEESIRVAGQLKKKKKKKFYLPLSKENSVLEKKKVFILFGSKTQYLLCTKHIFTSMVLVLDARKKHNCSCGDGLKIDAAVEKLFKWLQVRVERRAYASHPQPESQPCYWLHRMESIPGVSRVYLGELDTIILECPDSLNGQVARGVVAMIAGEMQAVYYQDEFVWAPLLKDLHLVPASCFWHWLPAAGIVDAQDIESCLMQSATSKLP